MMDREGADMDIIHLKEKEIYKKEDRGFANLVDEKYLQINQVCLEPASRFPSTTQIPM